ncbi:flagella basal body P-ring formation protein FlgA [Nitrosomonas sp. PY1]|nr:flagella basal body P-ring formation protein FlgA [Nitrosomonas sp. PY1]
MLMHNAVFASNHSAEEQHQDLLLIRNAVEDFVYRNTATLAGQVTVNVDKIDKYLTLPKCPELQPFIPPGSRLWGKTSVGVRCNHQDIHWTIYVQTEVNVMSDVLHIARPVSTGHALTYEDITSQAVNLTQMPDGIFTNPAQVIGKIATTNLTVGQPVRQHMLRAPYVIQRGQKVSLIVTGRGFSVSSEGSALNDAAENQVVQVRNKSGRILSGIARLNGIVEIQP